MVVPPGVVSPRFSKGFGWRTGSAASLPTRRSAWSARPCPGRKVVQGVPHSSGHVSDKRGGTKLLLQLPTQKGHYACHGDDAPASSQRACVGTPSLRHYALGSRNDDNLCRYTTACNDTLNGDAPEGRCCRQRPWALLKKGRSHGSPHDTENSDRQGTLSA